jgi:hypothetical protein
VAPKVTDELVSIQDHERHARCGGLAAGVAIHGG